MTLFATIAVILNMAAAVAHVPAWARLAAIAANVAFVFAGSASGEMLVYAPHLALIPLNAALFIGALGGRAA